MNPNAYDDRPSDPDGETKLRALFDATVEPPTGPTLTKLLARATDVPERAQRAPLWLPRWAWKPTAAGLAVAAGAFGFALFETPVGAPQPPAAATNSAVEPAVALSAQPRMAAATRAAPAETDLDGELDDTEVVAGVDTEWNVALAGDEALDPLYDPPVEDLDDWLHATALVLEEGG